MVEMSMLIPIIVALAELWKKVFGEKVTKFIPLINLALGIAGGIVYSSTIKEGIYNGILAGLSASGLYSSAKNIVQGVGKA